VHSHPVLSRHSRHLLSICSSCLKNQATLHCHSCDENTCNSCSLTEKHKGHEILSLGINLCVFFRCYFFPSSFVLKIHFHY
jgi:hypothetical protein